MALHPIDDAHLAQIKAGTVGRTRGHDFEKNLTAYINALQIVPDLTTPLSPKQHLICGHPATKLVHYICAKEGLDRLVSVQAWWLGGLATSGQGDTLMGTDGQAVARSKSDLVVEICHALGKLAVGVSVKTCSKPTPTNDQLYFTTASAFCSLLRRNGVAVSDQAERGLKMFCGDSGYRPADQAGALTGRISDPDRWFWEELPHASRAEWEVILTQQQRHVSTILLQKAYAGDPFAPSYLLHQTVKFSDIQQCPMAIFSIEELLDYTCKVGGFSTKQYCIRKGRFKHDTNPHLAPRFGFIQFQRAGNKQHPTQLQFNLQAAYFNKLPLDAI